MKEDSHLKLIRIENFLCLHRGDLNKGEVPKKSNYIYVDFESADWKHRLNAPGKEHLLQAIGLKKKYNKILDLTCGFGQDAYLLASCGCEVLAVESSIEVYSLVKDALDRKTDKSINFEVCNDDSIQFLSQLTQVVDVIYLDPMFPEKKKSSLPSKEMQFLKELLGDKGRGKGMLSAALEYPCKRIVVKRPVKAPFLESTEPDFQIKTKTIRYDVYNGLDIKKAET